MNITQLKTCSEVAAETGYTPDGIRKAAVRHGIGIKVTGRLRMLSPSDVRKLKSILRDKRV